jgi:hypothetical protein
MWLKNGIKQQMIRIQPYKCTPLAIRIKANAVKNIKQNTENTLLGLMLDQGTSGFVQGGTNTHVYIVSP